MARSYFYAEMPGKPTQLCVRQVRKKFDICIFSLFFVLHKAICKDTVG